LLEFVHHAFEPREPVAMLVHSQCERAIHSLYDNHGPSAADRSVEMAERNR
jgi:hypothetical protein